MKGERSSSLYPLFKHTKDHSHSPAVCVVFLYMQSEDQNVFCQDNFVRQGHFNRSSFNKGGGGAGCNSFWGKETKICIWS